MTNNVVQFNRPPDKSLAEGPAHCIGCKHQWHAVVPVGDLWLKCPSCEAHKGILDYPHGVEEDGITEIWLCNCGGDVFYILRHATYCCNCGLPQNFDD